LAPFTLSFADRLLTVREVAALLRVSTRTVYMFCDQGRLKRRSLDLGFGEGASKPAVDSMERERSAEAA